MKKIKFVVFALLSVVMLCFGFITPQQDICYATTTPQISIDAPDTIAIGNFPEYLEFTATLSSTESYTPDQICWTINSSSMTDVTTFSNSSILTVDKTIYQNIVSKTTWIIIAKINNDIYCQKTLVFDFTDVESVQVDIIGPLVQDAGSVLVPVTLEANITGYPSTTTFEWYKKSYANKYSKINTSANSYTFTPNLPGTYTFKACVNGVFSQDVSVYVNFKPVTELTLKCNQATNNASNLNRFVFTLENLNQSNDLSKINWYIKGTGLVQQGGKTFEFQTNQYGSYYVYAEYVDTENNIVVKSEHYPLEITVDRTKDILIFCGIILAIMVVFLIIGSIRMVKRDRIY